jgi:hypothetical protein
MSVPILALSAFILAQAAQVAPPVVISVLHEIVGGDDVIRLSLSGPPGSYSSTREGNEILLRITARAAPGLTLPAPKDPISAVALSPQADFVLRVSLKEVRPYEIIREMASLRLIIKAAPASVGSPTTTTASPEPSTSPSPPAAADSVASADPQAVDTADLYRRLFPATEDPSAVTTRRTEIGKEENWYSNFRWLGLQARPWLSVTYVNGKTTLVETNTISADSYWVVQPNLGLGFSPRIPLLSGASAREGQWKINYTPRFRRRGKENLPRLTSHFFDVGLDQPVASFGALYGTYHFSKGVLETDEVDGGREYGIGLNRVVDTTLERFKRQTFGVGLRLNSVAETEVDVNASKTSVRYGDDVSGGATNSGQRAFFDYDTRFLNASMKRGLGESRFLSLVFSVHDTPPQRERKQVEGRGYSYGASIEGDIAALTTGRLVGGYRTQKNPNAGEGGQDYRDFFYGAQLVRELSEETNIGFEAERRLFLSAYADNGFYVTDLFKGNVATVLPLQFSLRGSAGLQLNNYKASPQTNDGSTLVLRRDKIKQWSVGLSRNLAEWLFFRLDYIAEHRDSNLDRFDIKTRALSVQLGLGFFGKPGGQARPSW